MNTVEPAQDREPNFRVKKRCTCNMWKIGMREIDGLTILGFTHNMRLTAPIFEYCPWCGKKLRWRNVDE